MTVIYQTKDNDGTVKTWVGAKPIFNTYEGDWYVNNIDCEYEFNYPLFPAVPDRGEILKIIINEGGAAGGTWKAEKIYENGFYFAKNSNLENHEVIIIHRDGEWYHRDNTKIFQPDLFVKISNKKIPDDCLI